MKIKYISILFIASVLLGCDDDELPDVVVSFGGRGEVQIVEGSLAEIVSSYGPAIFLSRPAPQDVTVYLSASGEAAIGEDYTYSNSVLIRKGETFGTVNLQFIDDKLDEFDEHGKF